MRKLRRLTALLTTISIIFGVLSTAMAGTPLGTPDQSTAYSNSRGDVIFSVLGTTPAANDKSGKGGSYYQGTMDEITKPVDGAITWEENGLLWLQISVENMSRLRDMFNSGKTDSNAKSGLNSTSMAIAYDTDYFSLPSNTSNYGAAQTKRLLQGNYPKTYNDSYVTPLYDFGQEPSSYDILYNASGKDTIKEPTLTQYITQKNSGTPDYTKIGIYKINTENISDNTQPDDSLLFQDGAVPVYDKADTIDYSNLTPVTNDEFTMFLIPLKMKGTSAPDGKVIESYFDGSLSTMIVGTSANADEYVLYSYDNRRSQNAATNLNNRINIVDNLVTFFSDAATQTGIAVTTDSTFTTTLKDMQDVTGITGVTKTMSDSSTPAITDYKLYYGPDNGSTGVSASKSSLTNFATDYHEIKTSETDVWQNGVPKDTANGQYLYVVAGDYVWNLGQLTVTDTAINAIKGVTGEQPAAGTTLYTGDNIVIPNTTKVTVGYDNGKDKELSKTEADTAGLKFYRVDNNSGAEALTEVVGGATPTKYTATDKEKLTIKKDSIRLSTGDPAKDYYEVPVTYNKVTLTANSGSELTKKYNANDTIDLSKVKVDAATLSNTTPATLTYGSNGQTFTDAGVKIVIIEPSKAASKAELYAARGIANGTTITQAMIDGNGTEGYHVVAVAANDKADNVSFVDLGTISAKAGDTYAVDGTLALAGSTDADKTYPNAKLDLTSAKVKVTNADDATKNDEIALTDAGVTLSIVTKGATPDADTELQASVNANTVIKPEWAGKSLKIVVNGKTLYATIPTVTKKTLTLTFSGTVTDRDYNGKTDKSVPTGITAALPTTGGVEAGDIAPTVPAITYTYADGNAADNKAITAAINAGATTEFDNYILVLPTDGATGITGNIKPKTVNPTLVVTVKQSPTQATDYTLTNADATVSGTSPFGTDNVTVKVSGTIAANDMKTEGDGKAVTSPTYTLDGDDKDNYTLGSSTAVTAKVTNLPTATALKDTTAIDDAIAKYNNIKAADDKNTEENLITKKAELPTTGKATAKVNGVDTDFDVNISWTVDNAYTATGTTYTYTATVTPKDPTEVIVNIATPITKTVEVKASTGKPAATDFPDVTKAKFEDASAVTHESLGLNMGGKITVDGKDVNYTVTWDAVTLDATQANATQTFNGTLDFTGAPDWFTAPTGNDLKVTQKVTIAPDAKADHIKDDADSKAAIELIKNGVTLKANDEANKDIDTLIAKLPKTITVVDNKGNDHTLDIDWAADKAFNIKGDTYTVTPTLKVQTGDSLDLTDFAPADIKATKIEIKPIHVQPIGTTYGSVTITQGKDPATAITFIKSGDTTDDPDVKAEFTIDWTPEASALDTSTAGNSQVFTGTVKINETTYPWLSYPVDENGNEKKSDTLTVTVKKKGTGGGGGVSTYAVKFNAGSNGKITEGKTSVNITSGKKVETTNLPTVTPNEGYKFLGWSTDGKTVIDPTADVVKKSLTYTALYEEVNVKPTTEPTTKPTDKPDPVINVQYTKPYASGYEDGSFRPENNITRAELASMIARLSYGDDLPDGIATASFSDVESDAWFNKYVGYLEDLDVLSGYEDGTFRPYNTVTRGEIATVIARAQRYDLIPYTGEFADVTEDDWAKDNIQTLVSNGIASGYEDGTFGPYSSLTRAEAVTMINNVLVPSTAIVTFTPNDIEGYWAEGNILLAVNERKINGAADPEVTPEATPEVTPEAAPEMNPDAKLDVTPEATAEPTETPAA